MITNHADIDVTIGIDDSLQTPLAFAAVLGPESSHDVLVDSPGDFDFGEVRDSEEAGDSLMLSPREQVRARPDAQ